MSVREYIGARYVPVFADPIQWDPTSIYEPLTVVTDQGASYVSRRYVPEGILLNNTDYWVLWADFNAQLQHYIDEVDAFDGRIDALEDALPIADFSAVNTVSDKFPVATANIDDAAVTSVKIADGSITNGKLDATLQRAVSTKHLVVIGDSFSTPAYSSEGNMWYTAVKRQQNLVLHNYAQSGRGYIHPGTEATNFGAQLTQAANDPSFENSDVRLIIIFGGINDYAAFSGTNLYTACFNVLESAISSFPKSKIIVAGMNTYNTYDRTIYSMTVQLRNAAIAQGVSFIDTSWLFFGSSFISEEFNWHPNDNGQLEIAYMFNSALAGMPLVKDIYSDYDTTISGNVGTLRFYRNGYGVYAFGTMQTNASGNCSMKFANGIGNLIYQPIFLFNPNAAKPVAQGVWNYTTDTLSITGATPSTSYTTAKMIKSF